ncbi:PstS family phosphate ABC transporter substrate-binding protein [Ructibacterium gallinarum]|uniref:Substrate-binding domain-containing protein n=1 Tax=Ructibacterium gallinarum TaxID=2779355 RepID=A0A9D5LYK9_9FIRM|nr:substrate-binding domain-containing protein [Ructibacterium gallinarum]MBE5039277.1 substrate-binding domain-containing protein [Ructibacterium gallinarum]
MESIWMLLGAFALSFLLIAAVQNVRHRWLKAVVCIGCFAFIAVCCLLAVFQASFSEFPYTKLLCNSLILECVCVFGYLLLFLLKKRNRGIMTLLGSFCVLCAVVPAWYLSFDSVWVFTEELEFANTGHYQYMPSVRKDEFGQENPIAWKEPLPKIDGDEGSFPFYASAAEVLYPETEKKKLVVSSGLYAAFYQLLDGKADLIFLKELPNSFLEEAAQKGISLQITPIGKKGLVFMTHEKNPVDDLSVEQIRDIYSGAVTDWTQVGGKDAPIHTYQSRQILPSFYTMENLLDGMDPVQPQMMKKAMDPMPHPYRNEKNAIGYAYFDDAMKIPDHVPVKLLKINGVMPTQETMQNGSYPLLSEMYAVTAGGENPNLAALLEWMLSADGQKLLEETGYIPVTPADER